MRWHQGTAALLGTPLVPSAPLGALLTAAEHAHGFTSPESVREWYELDGGVALLREHSNDDEPVPIEALGRPFPQWYDGGRRDLVREGRLVFLIENQGVCQWAVDLSGSADPPVRVIVDPQPGDDWTLCSESFSDFVFCQVWDHPRWEFWAEAQMASLDPAALGALRRSASEQQQTFGWPGHTTYRFAVGRSRIVIWDGGDGSGADWKLLAPTMADFEEGLAALPGTQDLVARLYSSNDGCTRALQRRHGAQD